MGDTIVTTVRSRSFFKYSPTDCLYPEAIHSLFGKLQSHISAMHTPSHNTIRRVHTSLIRSTESMFVLVTPVVVIA